MGRGSLAKLSALGYRALGETHTSGEAVRGRLTTRLGASLSEARRKTYITSVCLAPGFSTMSYRAKPYRIRILGSRQPHRISPAIWHRFIALGWLVVVGSRIAQVRKGVMAWLEDGKLRLQDKEAGVSVSIACSWAWVERAALYDTSGPMVGSFEYERLIQRHHCER